MMHGTVKRKEELTPVEKQARDQKAAKVLEMTDYFFKVRKGEVAAPDDPLAFTELMAQLCTEIATIYNYRREILEKQIAQLKENDAASLSKLIQKEFQLITILLKKHPKSYTLWTHRQWTVLQSIEIDKVLKEKELPLIQSVQTEYLLCVKMLQMDERNFHVWNYRNWLNSVTNFANDEDKFLKQKIEQNFSNFSAYHFRSKYLLKIHNNNDSLKARVITEGNLGIIPIPKNILEEELELISQAIYIQPKEHGVWLYQRWLIGVIQPFGIRNIIITNDKVEIYFNKKAQKISNHLVFSCPIELLNEEQFGDKIIYKKPEQDHFLVSLNNRILQQIDDPYIDQDTSSRFVLNQQITITENKVYGVANDLNDVYEFVIQTTKQKIEFLKEVIKEEANNHFAYIQILYLYRYLVSTLSLTKKIDDLKSIIDEAFDYSQKLVKFNQSQVSLYLNNQWKESYEEALQQKGGWL